MGISRQHNGTLDAMAFYGEAGDVVRIEISTRGDATFNSVEFYQFGSLARVEEDTNADGRSTSGKPYAVDPRATPGQRGPIVTAAFDDAFRGTPTRRFVYRPDGSVSFASRWTGRRWHLPGIDGSRPRTAPWRSRLNAASLTIALAFRLFGSGRGD